MLNKNEIKRELKNEEFIVRNAVYEHICNLHLYDDKEINEAFIEFIKDNYRQINMAGLRFSKLNKEIIQCLIDIRLKEDNEILKGSIDKVLVNHYSLIKDLDYDFEKMIINENDLLIYKKIKHFSGKDADKLIELYKNNIENYYLNDEDTLITEIIRMAIGIALIQTEKGLNNLIKYVIELVEEADEYNDLSELLEVHMPYLVYPLCNCDIKEYAWIMLKLYIYNMDFIGYADECNHYFSNICDDEFVDSYIKRLGEIKKSEKESYYYDIAEYLDSNKVDEFLLKELKTTKNQEIRENIIRILASRFNKDVIPYALDYVQKGIFDDEEGIKLVLAPLLIIEKKDDSISKQIIEEAKQIYSYDYEQIKDELFSRILKEMQEEMLKEKEHIKTYKKVRKIHEEIMNEMMKYYNSGKFKIEIIPTQEKTKISNIEFIDTYFDTCTPVGTHALADIIVYKNAPNIPCLTEKFIENNQYRKEEKKDMLNSMLNSETGLFEIINTDRSEGKIYLRNVFDNKEYCIIDIALSSNLNNEKCYIYTRIITYNDISFGTGLLLTFDKNDEFIKKWINTNKGKINKEQNFTQFLELYNAYIGNSNKVKIITNRI